jgi:hypothetical protein
VGMEKVHLRNVEKHGTRAMTEKRMMHRQFFESEAIANLTLRQRLLIIGIITIADDQGRTKGHPGWLKAQIFPYDDIQSADVKKDLEQIVTNNDTIIIYKIGGKQYIQLTHWWKYQALQWAKESEYPPPPDWKDRIRQMIYKPERWVMTQNWPDTEDRLCYQVIALGNELGDEAADALGIINTTTTINVKSNVKTPEEVVKAQKSQKESISEAFVETTKIPEYTGGREKWDQALEDLTKAGVEPKDIKIAVAELQQKNYRITKIGSVVNAAISVMSKRKSKTHNNKDDPQRYIDDLVKYGIYDETT